MKWFGSELVAAALQAVGVKVNVPEKVTPKDLTESKFMEECDGYSRNNQDASERSE
jgi:hypothetical protein